MEKYKVSKIKETNWNKLKKVETKLEKMLDKLVNTRKDNYNNYEEIREAFWKLQEYINCLDSSESAY